jgi:hypothetical protein
VKLMLSQPLKLSEVPGSNAAAKSAAPNFDAVPATGEFQS